MAPYVYAFRKKKREKKKERTKRIYDCDYSATLGMGPFNKCSLQSKQRSSAKDDAEIMFRPKKGLRCIPLLDVSRDYVVLNVTAFYIA